MTTEHERRGALEAIERIVNRGGEPEDVFADATRALGAVYGAVEITSAEHGLEIRVADRTAEDAPFLDRIALLLSAYA